MCPKNSHLPPHTLTFLASLLPGSVDVVLELDADLPLCGLVSDEGELQQLLRWWAAQVSLDETRVNEVDELLRPGNDSGSARRAPLEDCEGHHRRKRGEHSFKSHLYFPPNTSVSNALAAVPPPPNTSSTVRQIQA